MDPQWYHIFFMFFIWNAYKSKDSFAKYPQSIVLLIEKFHVHQHVSNEFISRPILWFLNIFFNFKKITKIRWFFLRNDIFVKIVMCSFIKVFVRSLIHIFLDVYIWISSAAFVYSFLVYLFFNNAFNFVIFVSSIITFIRHIANLLFKSIINIYPLWFLCVHFYHNE